MKRKFVCMLSAALLVSLAGCSSSKKTSKEETQTPVSTGTEIKTEYGSLTLGNYKNLSESKKIYKVTDEDIESEIESIMQEYAEQKEVKRASKDGDYLSVNMIVKIGDETVLDCSEDETEIGLGQEYYGADVDKELTGVSAGDKRSFSVKYAKDYEDEEWAGKTAKFSVTVNSVVEENVPECTDKFVSENLEYDSVADMKEKVKADLESQNESQSETELGEDLLQQVINASNVTEYSDELYASAKKSIEENYDYYASMYGYESGEEFYTAFGMTEDDINEEIMGLVNRTLVIDAISSSENLSISDSEYKAGLEAYASDYGYDSAEELEQEYDEDTIRNWLLEDKTLDFLKDNATVTEVEATDSEE